MTRKTIEEKEIKINPSEATAGKEYPLMPENGFPEKAKPKTVDEIMQEITVDLPVNNVKPVNQRMFLFEVSTKEVMTRAGIILPTSFTQNKSGNQVKRDIKRYFVIDVAGDCLVSFRTVNGQIRKIKRGDEVFPFFPEEMLHWSLPKVIDWNNGALQYCVVHETELGGASEGLIVKEDEKEKEGNK